MQRGQACIMFFAFTRTSEQTPKQRQLRLAPIKDFAYSVLAFTLTNALWLPFGRLIFFLHTLSVMCVYTIFPQ